MDTYYGRYKKTCTRKLARRHTGLLRLWTFQPMKLWETLQSENVLTVEPDLIKDYDIFHTPYDWMRGEMAHRLPNYKGHYPWWAYFQSIPDLRGWYGSFPQEHGVRLELQISADRVLISDYETWHLVLSQNYIPLTQLEDDIWEKEMANHSDISQPLPAPWPAHIFDSWKRVFDLKALSTGGLWPADHLQACFEELRLIDVVEVTFLAPV